jgi:hypothetical protein
LEPSKESGDVFGGFFRQNRRNVPGLYVYTIPGAFRHFCLEKSIRKPKTFFAPRPVFPLRAQRKVQVFGGHSPSIQIAKS